MPRKRSTAPRKTPQKMRHEDKYGVEFVNITLSTDDVLHLREWTVSEGDLWLELERLSENGYKVSLSVDLENTGGIVAVTGKRGCNPPENEGRCLVSRGPDIRGALLATLYKLEAYCPDGMFPTANTDARPDFS